MRKRKGRPTSPQGNKIDQDNDKSKESESRIIYYAVHALEWYLLVAKEKKNYKGS